MNIRRYVAPDMRTAFKLVRDELGPDVVILSTRRVKGQIELTVASDQNPTVQNTTNAVKEVSFPSLTPRADSTAANVFASEPSPDRISLSRAATVTSAQREAAAAALTAKAAPSPAPVNVAPVAPMAPVAPTAPVAQAPITVPAQAAAPVPAPAAAAAPTALDGELKALRRLLETQLAALAWNDMSRRSPATAALLRELIDLGFSREFAAQLVESIEPQADLATARRLMHERLDQRIRVTGDTWAEKGGTIAVVGPAGAGKTTALAALAARWVMRNGTQGAALISVGESRFGVQENLARVGRLVGISVYVLDKVAELPALLKRLSDRRMILIDTAGCSPRSASFERHVRELRDALPKATFALTLSAATQVGTIREVVAGYRNLGDLSCIVTHTDECTTLGGLLSAVIDADIPVAYTLDGQRLLDDLRPARADALVDLASTLAERHRSVAGDTEYFTRLEGRLNVS